MANSSFAFWNFWGFSPTIYVFLKFPPKAMVTDFRERKGERNTDVIEKHRLVASHKHPNGGLNPQSMYVSWLGMKPATLWCIEWRSNQLSQPGQDSPQYIWSRVGWLHECENCGYRVATIYTTTLYHATFNLPYQTLPSIFHSIHNL